MRFFGAAFLLCFCVGTALADPVYDTSEVQAYLRDGTIAYRAGDYAAAETAFASAAMYGPQQPDAFYNLAAAAARRGDKGRALAALDRFANFGLFMNLDRDASFAALRGGEDFARIRQKLARQTAPVCSCRVMFQGSNAPFIAEGVAHDLRTERVFVSGVSARKIVAIHNGAAHDFAVVPDGMSALGIRINAAHDLLWAAASTLPQSDGGSGDMGNAALLAFDITSGALRARYNAPTYAPHRSFSDLTFAPDGTAYVSDAIEGSIFRLTPGADRLEIVGGQAARFKSPQGMVVSADGKTLLVADYSAGLQRLDIESGVVDPVAVPAGISTLGMDGLVLLPDGSFAATQNLFAPHRVVHFRLSRDWSRLESLSVIARATADMSDISLLTPDGNNLLVVGTSQWASFEGDNGTSTRPLKNWRVVRVVVP
jgi:sugar lactone lactonase YvrE